MNKLYSVMFAWSNFFELNRVPACCKDDLNLLELRICMVFCRASLWKLHMDLSKSTILYVKQRKNDQQLLKQNYFCPRHHQLLSWQVPKSEWFPSGFRAPPKTHLKPHFAYFRTFLNIFEQNEWQIHFPQPILCWFPKSDFGHWSTPLKLIL